MSIPIVAKKRVADNTAPSAAQMLVGEVAFNGVDGSFYSKKSDGTIVLVGGPNSQGGFRNRIINGDMRIDQQNAGTALTHVGGNNMYGPDMWVFNANGTPKFSVQQVVDAPTGSGFVNSLRVLVTTSGTPGAADSAYVSQYIEGLNFADAAFGTASAKRVAISFWVKSSITGTYTVTIFNSAANRIYATTYAISVANTWEYKTVTIPGDTSGTWLTDTGRGLTLFFNMGTGSNNNGAGGSWGTSGSVVTGTVALVTNAAATWNLTGVQLEIGSAATSFEARDYQSELARCQRYFEKSASDVRAILTVNEASASIVTAATSIANDAYYAFVPFKVTKRIAPTVTCYPFTTPTNTIRLSNDVGTDYGANSAVAAGNFWGFRLRNQSGGALAVGAQQLILGGWYADARL